MALKVIFLFSEKTGKSPFLRTNGNESSLYQTFQVKGWRAVLFGRVTFCEAIWGSSCENLVGCNFVAYKTGWFDRKVSQISCDSQGRRFQMSPKIGEIFFILTVAYIIWMAQISTYIICPLLCYVFFFWGSLKRGLMFHEKFTIILPDFFRRPQVSHYLAAVPATRRCELSRETLGAWDVDVN